MKFFKSTLVVAGLMAVLGASITPLAPHADAQKVGKQTNTRSMKMKAYGTFTVATAAFLATAAAGRYFQNAKQLKNPSDQANPFATDLRPDLPNPFATDPRPALPNPFATDPRPDLPNPFVTDPRPAL